MFVRSFHCHVQYGMVNKKHIALRNVQEVSFASGIYKILIQIQRRKENWLPQQDSHRLKLAIGLKIEGNAIERLLQRTGKSLMIITMCSCEQLFFSQYISQLLNTTAATNIHRYEEKIDSIDEK